MLSVTDEAKMLRVNVKLKLLLFLLSGLALIATWSLWNRCLDGLHTPGWDNNFKHDGDGPLQVSWAVLS